MAEARLGLPRTPYRLLVPALSPGMLLAQLLLRTVWHHPLP